jgi:methylisocitrate lyase
MVDRIKAAVDARTDSAFVLMARTDSFAVEGLQGAVERVCRYVEAGADMVFPEALTALDDYRQFTEAVAVPVLANLTEFGRTPLFTLEQLRASGVRLALYPLSAFRAMSAAAQQVYETLRRQGTQKELISLMQTREELYDVLDYHAHERRLDELLSKESEDA